MTMVRQAVVVAAIVVEEQAHAVWFDVGLPSGLEMGYSFISGGVH